METIQVPKSGRGFGFVKTYGFIENLRVQLLRLENQFTCLHKSDCLNILLVIKEGDIKDRNADYQNWHSLCVFVI